MPRWQCVRKNTVYVFSSTHSMVETKSATNRKPVTLLDTTTCGVGVMVRSRWCEGQSPCSTTLSTQQQWTHVGFTSMQLERGELSGGACGTVGSLSCSRGDDMHGTTVLATASHPWPEEKSSVSGQPPMQKLLRCCAMGQLVLFYYYLYKNVMI